MTGSVGELWAEGISAGLAANLPKQGKPQRRKLATMVATMLKVRSANLMELASGLPTETARCDMRYQWITRLLASDLLDCGTVMRPFATDIFRNLQERGEPITLIGRADENATAGRPIRHLRPMISPPPFPKASHTDRRVDPADKADCIAFGVSQST